MPGLSNLRARRRTRGQSIVEFALILPVLMLLLLITLDFGRLFMSYISLTNTTRVAANYGSLNPSSFGSPPDTTTYNAVVNRESAGLNCKLQPDGGGHIPPIPTYPTGNGLSGKSVATMTCDFSLLTPFLTNFFGGPLAITSKAEFPIRTGAIANIDGTVVLPPPGSPFADFDFTGVTGGTADGAGNVSGLGPITVNVMDGSTGAQTWEWDWGDLSPHDFTATPGAHQYSAVGAYTVQLTIRNPVGSSSHSQTVTVTNPPPPNPVAGFYGTPIAGGSRYIEGGGSAGTAIRGSLDLVVQFTNTSTDGTSYSWDFGDGTGPFTGSSQQHTYSKLGIFDVSLTITAPTGGTPSVRTSYVTTGCVVPNFPGTSTGTADATWSAAGFTGNVTYRAGPSGQVKNKAPNPARPIVAQTGPAAGGGFVPATPAPGFKWECAGDILLEYTP
jgi:PKD repeat protein